MHSNHTNARRPVILRKTSIGLALLLSLFLGHAYLWAAGPVRVRGYVRKDGTYVRPHYRSAPDGNPHNNWSFPGNVNPHTGKVATGNPATYLFHYYRARPSGRLSLPALRFNLPSYIPDHRRGLQRDLQTQWPLLLRQLESQRRPLRTDMERLRRELEAQRLLLRREIERLRKALDTELGLW